MKIQKNVRIAAGFLVAVMFSCNADTSSDTPIITDPQPAPVTTTATPEQPSASTPAFITEPVTVQPAQQVVLNPAHGQPGHDCAVPVGSPLNSPAAASLSPTATTPIRTGPALPNFMGGSGVTTSANNTASSGSQRLNPAHGQPGHDCSVAVGAPLPS